MRRVVLSVPHFLFMLETLAKRGAADCRDGFALTDRLVRHHPVAGPVLVEQRAQPLVDITFYWRASSR